MHEHNSSFWLSPKGLMALGLIAAVSYFLLVEHQQHFFQFLPYIIILLCPLMHIFMHSGHGHADEGAREAYQRGLDEGRRQPDMHHPRDGRK